MYYRYKYSLLHDTKIWFWPQIVQQSFIISRSNLNNPSCTLTLSKPRDLIYNFRNIKIKNTNYLNMKRKKYHNFFVRNYNKIRPNMEFYFDTIHKPIYIWKESGKPVKPFRPTNRKFYWKRFIGKDKTMLVFLVLFKVVVICFSCKN